MHGSGSPPQRGPLHRASRCLPGHLAIFWIGSIPLFAWSIYTMRENGTLTLGWAVLMLTLCCGGGVIAGVSFWFTFSRPLLRSRWEQV